MTTYLPKEVAAGLEAARKTALRKKSRLRIEANGSRVKVLSLWDDGFSVEREDAPNLRGLVDMFDGGRHLYQCLIVASEEDGDEMRYDFKRSTEATDRAPLDFVRPDDAPIALLGS